MAPLVDSSAPSPLPVLDSGLSRARLFHFVKTAVLSRLAQRSFQIVAAIWTAVLVVCSVSVWDRGFGAVPLVERPLAMLVLAAAATIGGLRLRTWLWPVTVSTIWLVIVGGSQLWMIASTSGGAYLERWRVIAPTQRHNGLFAPDKTEFTTSDILALVLSGAAIPCVAAIAGVLTMRRPANGGDWLMALGAAVLAGVGAIQAAEFDFIGLMLLAVPFGFVSGLVVGRWYWTGLAVASVGLATSLVMALRVLASGIEAEWRNTAVEGVPGFLGKNYPSFADQVRPGWWIAVILVGGAVLFGQVIRWFFVSARRQRSGADRRLPPRGVGLPPADTAGA